MGLRSWACVPIFAFSRPGVFLQPMEVLKLHMDHLNRVPRPVVVVKISVAETKLFIFGKLCMAPAPPYSLILAPGPAPA